MHEAGIMESALAIIAREAIANGASRVERVTLRVGAISGADPQALRFAFEALSPGTVADGAELLIEHVPAMARCGGCGCEFTVDSGSIFQCPGCRAFCGDIRSGRELDLARLEFLQSTTPEHVHQP